MSDPAKSPKKLIEVALPLDDINEACAREKSIRHGHPSTLHLWWARRPLAAARAVIFAQLVNDPASLWEFQNPGQTPSLQQRGGFTQRRDYLFKLISEFVKWENTTNEDLLKRARREIRDSWREVCALNKDHPAAGTLFNPGSLPGLHDPFAGGGAIPLEAQRLGLEAFASDLNPLAVLINKAMIEIPPKFAGRPPVGPLVPADGEVLSVNLAWQGALGLAEDVRRYATWLHTEATRKLLALYPEVEITEALALGRADLTPLLGKRLPVVAWSWARTVRSPNPAFSHVPVPLVSNFVLSRKEGSCAWVDVEIDLDTFRFVVRPSEPPSAAEAGTKGAGRGSHFTCLLSGAPISGDYIKREGQAGRLGHRLMAVVAQGPHGRVYLPPIGEDVAASARADWQPSGDVPARLTGGTCVPYGLREWGNLFTPRQLVALTTMCDLVAHAREQVLLDSVAAGWPSDGVRLEDGGSAADAYADAVSVYLGLIVDRLADRNSSLCSWDLAQAARGREATVRNVFARQAIPMTWDFVEVNILGDFAGGFGSAARAVVRVVERLDSARTPGTATQADATTQRITSGRFVSTDPPYYDNIAYADLSDFFYVWLRRALRPVLPNLFSTMTVPKEEELVAAPYRRGGREQAERFFLDGMTRAMRSLASQAQPTTPVTIYYAFKQSDTKGDAGTSSTGWETFLEAVLRAGLSVTGTWPMRTELGNRMVGSGTNALASSIVLVCRPRPEAATTVSRREFLRELNGVLPSALADMIRSADGDRSPVAPVDLSQAIIGPGMAVFSKYAAVLEADGTPMTVKTALQLINRFLAEDDFDGDTQFCLHWFDQHGWNEGAYGDADVLARAKATSVGGLDQAGVVQSGGGKVRLLRPTEYPADWNPSADKRLPVWEALHHLVRAFKADGESGAGRILGVVKAKTEAIRQLAYRLYTLCERRGWAEDARAYNELVTSWSSVETVANAIPESAPKQQPLFGERR